jgi:hypothetical protein
VPTAAAWVARQPGAAAPASSCRTGPVHEYGLVRGPAGLVAAVDVDPSHEPGAVHRVLEDRRGHLAAEPLHVPRRRSAD